MENEFGRAFTELPIKKIGAGSMFMEHFERAKRKFQGSHVSNENIELPLALNLSKVDGNTEAAEFRYDQEDETIKISRSRSIDDSKGHG